jgi:hypothetical protein
MIIFRLSTNLKQHFQNLILKRFAHANVKGMTKRRFFSMKKHLVYLLFITLMAPVIFGARPQFEPFDYPDHPVITPGFQGDLDRSYVLHPELYWDGDQFRMYYTGVDSLGISRILLALSDNVVDWTPAGIVLEPLSGTFDKDGVSAPDILNVDGKYHLYYTAETGGWLQIAHVSSVDGFDFSGPRTLVLGPSYNHKRFDAISVANPSVVYHNDSFHMVYRGYDGSPWRRLGLAISPDGVDFSRVLSHSDTGAIFGRGPYGFDDGGTDEPEIWIGQDNTIRMLYTSLHY